MVARLRSSHPSRFPSPVGTTAVAIAAALLLLVSTGQALDLGSIDAALTSTWGAAAGRTPDSIPTTDSERLLGGCSLMQLDDGTFENGYAYNFFEVAPPDTGAFAKHFESPYPDPTVLLCEARFFFTTVPQYPQGASLYTAIVYAHDAQNGRPGAEILRVSGIDPGVVPNFPSFVESTVDFGQVEVPREFWVAWWPEWAGAEAEWFIGADENGTEPTPVDHTNAQTAPGWLPVKDADFPNCKNLAIRAAMAAIDGPEPLIPISAQEPADAGCPAYSNATPDTALVCSFTIAASDPAVPWIRIHFDLFDIGLRDFVRFTSTETGDSYDVEGREAVLSPLEYYSLFLDGDEVLVELYAVPGGAGGGIHADFIDVGLIPPPSDTICGADNRQSSNDARVARLKIKKNDGKTYVCTAFLISNNGCYATAGHCLDGVDLTKPGNVVAQHNVPASDADGSTNNPGAADQYKIDTAVTPCFRNNGRGDDYGVFKAKPNEKTKKNPSQAQGSHHDLKDSTPNVGDTVKVTGHGADDGADNFIQQDDSGQVTGVNGTTIEHKADTRGGNSGGPITNASGGVTGIHTHGGCRSDGTGSNAGTSVTSQGFRDCVDQVCAKECQVPPTESEPTVPVIATEILSMTLTSPQPIPITLTGERPLIMTWDPPIGSLPPIVDMDLIMPSPGQTTLPRLTCVGPIIIRTVDSRPSTGQAVPQGSSPCFPMDSFFDVFVEVEMPGLGLTLHNENPIHIAGTINSILPYGDTYSLTDPVPLVDGNGAPAGTLDAWSLTPQPPIDCIFVGGLFGIDFFGQPDLILTPGTTGIQHDAVFWDGANWVIPTELVQMDLRGFSPVLGSEIVVRVFQPGQPSYGNIVFAGLPYLQFPAESTFDVFYEITVENTGRVLVTDGPVHLRDPDGIGALPPLPGDVYQGENPVALIDRDTQEPVGILFQNQLDVGASFAWTPPPPAGIDGICSVSELTVDTGTSVQTFDGLVGDIVIRRLDPQPLPQPWGTTIPIEILELQLVSAAPIVVTTSPSPPSTGALVQPDPGPLFPMDSFFDVFITMTFEGRTLHNEQPARLEAPVNQIPPLDPYQLVAPVQLFDELNQPAGQLLNWTLDPELPYDPSPSCPVALDCRNLPTTGIQEPAPSPTPIALVALHPAAPNPFSGTTAIQFDLPRDGHVALRVYDVAGRLVRTLLDEDLRGQFRHEYVWDGRDGRGQQVGSGIYLFRLEAGGQELHRKALLIR